jgi:hypothetical protein
VVESNCPICASPVLPDQSHCPKCGAWLAGPSTGSEGARTEVPVTADLDTPEAEPYEDPRLALIFEDPLDQNSPDESPPEQRPPEQSPPEPLPGGDVPPSPVVESSAWAIRPSGTGSGPREPGSSLSLQLGAKPISLASREWSAPTPEPPVGPAVDEPIGPPPTAVTVPPAPASEPEPAPEPAPVPIPAPEQPTTPVPPGSPFAAPPVAAPAPPPPEPVPAAPARKETIQELVSFGLVAAGVSIGIASLFLPWAGATGIGIGTEMIAGSPPPPNQWGWGMPAGFPLFLLSLPVLAAIAASDRAQARFPRLAMAISRITDLILPMILGGLYVGVVLMYLTVPAGFGPGLYLGQLALVLGAALLIAGAIVTIFFPPEIDGKPD